MRNCPSRAQSCSEAVHAVKRLAALSLALILPSCGPSPAIHNAVNAKVASGDHMQAYQVVRKHKGAYSRRERLLYHMDAGLSAHYAGFYKKSNKDLKRAEQLGEQLYTKSLARTGLAFLLNDYVRPYRGEDFERALIHIFVALNYMKLGDLESALVEARKLDSKLNAMNLHYRTRKNVYKEDAFIRFISGLFYEMSGRLDDAVVDYTKVEEIFQGYRRNYGTSIPGFAVENLLSALDGAGFADRVADYSRRYPRIRLLPYRKKRRLGEIVLIHYHGQSPVKEAVDLPVTVSHGVVVHLSFPEYRTLERTKGGARVTVTSVGGGEQRSFETRLMENVEAIATQNLNNRVFRTQVKAIARLKAQYILIEQQTKMVREKFGDNAAEAFRFFSASVREVVSQADTRSCRTLPAEIRVGRVLVPPGTYQVRVVSPSGQPTRASHRLELGAGEKRFLILRSID